jgi:NAD(P)H dehydrogenase (quinone)
MFVFDMQHGMLWVGNPFLPEQHQGLPYNQAVNRLGSWSGLMAQAGHGKPPCLRGRRHQNGAPVRPAFC